MLREALNRLENIIRRVYAAFVYPQQQWLWHSERCMNKRLDKRRPEVVRFEGEAEFLMLSHHLLSRLAVCSVLYKYKS